MRSIGLFAVACSLFSACANQPDDEALNGVDVSGKADGIAAVGTYQLGSASKADGDIVALELFDDGSYVRLRCYGPKCALKVPETDQYKVISGASGKTYLLFEQFVWIDADAGTEDHKLLDMYEARVTSGGLE